MKKHAKKYFVPTKENDYTPHFFRGPAIFLLIVLIVILFGLSSVGRIALDRSGLLGAIYSSVLVDLANETRLEENLTPLKINPVLTQAAQLKANDMAEKGYFAHNGPDGTTPWYWMSLAGYKFIYAGENLAVNFDYSEDVNEAWLNSPGHRANIVSGNYTEVGIALAEGVYEGTETTFVVQMFGAPVPVLNTNVAPEPQTSVVGVVEEARIDRIPEPDIMVTEVVQDDEEIFIAFEDTRHTAELPATEGTPPVQGAEAPGFEAYTTWYDWIVLNPRVALEYILYVAAGIVLFALVLMIGINVREQRPKNIVYGVFVFVVLLLAIYLNTTGRIDELINTLF